MNKPDLTLHTNAAFSSHVSLGQVGKTYRSQKGQVTALSGIDLNIDRGEFLSILGPSGCGKSTLLMIIAGLIPASEGRVCVEGRTVTRPLTDIGIVFQQDLLFEWRTILGNVMLQAEIRGLDRNAARQKAISLLERAGLKGFENHYSWQLSGGMRQRAAICRALLHDTGLLLMDEPFGALDPLTRDKMNLDLQTLWLAQKPSTVLVTHSIGEAVLLSDRVIVLSRRPARIKVDLRIDLPRPRTAAMCDSEQFIAYQRQLRQEIEE